MIRSIWTAFLVIAVCAAFASSVAAQTVSSGNYRQYARCAETVIDGKIYSSFGPGPCPPGSKSRYGSFENDMAMRRTEATVAALAQIQQSALAIGGAIAERMRQESDRIRRNLYIDLDVRESEDLSALYLTTNRHFPRVSDTSVTATGGLLIATQVGYLSECIIPSFSQEKSGMANWTYYVHAGEPACKISKRDSAYTPTRPNSKSDNGYEYIYKIFLKNRKGNFDVCLHSMGMKFACKKDVPDSEIVFTVGFFGDRSLAKDLVFYAGVRGSDLLFHYYPGGLPGETRPDRVVEITANLSDSKVVKIGPYTVEVVDWSPTSIAAKLVAVD